MNRIDFRNLLGGPKKGKAFADIEYVLHVVSQKNKLESDYHKSNNFRDDPALKRPFLESFAMYNPDIVPIMNLLNDAEYISNDEFTLKGEVLYSQLQEEFKKESNSTELENLIRDFLEDMFSYQKYKGFKEELRDIYLNGGSKDPSGNLLLMQFLGLIRDNSPVIFSNTCSVEEILQKFVYPEVIELEDNSVFVDKTLVVEGCTDFSIINTAHLVLKGTTLPFRIYSHDTACGYPNFFNSLVNEDPSLNVLGLLDSDQEGLLQLEKLRELGFIDSETRNEEGVCVARGNCDVRMLPVPIELSEYLETDDSGKVYGFVIENSFKKNFLEKFEDGMILPKSPHDQNEIAYDSMGRFHPSDRKTDFAMALRRAYFKGELKKDDFEYFNKIFEIVETKFTA